MNTNAGFQYAGAQTQTGGTGFPGIGGSMQGLQNLQGNFLQNPLQQGRPGLGGISSGVSQQGSLAQQRLASGSLGLQQQLGQAQGRGGLGTQQYAAVNGLGGPRGSLGTSGALNTALVQQQQQQQLRQAGAGGMSGLAGLGGNFNANLAGLQRQGVGGQGGMAALGALGSNRLGGGLGGLAGLGGAGSQMGGPSGDLLAMINKSGQSQLASGGGGNAMGGGMVGLGRQVQAGVGGEQGEGPAFDAADFPSLTGGGQQGGGQRHMSGGGTGELPPRMATFATLLEGHKQPGAGGGGEGFSEEDFPALPGSGAGGGALSQQSVRGMDGLGADTLQQMQMANADGMDMLRLQQQQQLRQAAALKGVLGTNTAGSGGAGVAAGGGKLGMPSQPDRFGLLGLLSVIRMTEPDLTTLALGTDLTTLGLNLNSTESLWKTFASPWADGPSKPDPEFKVPQCYLHSPPRLQPGYFQKFQPDTLFYIFYGMPGDEAQLFAAEELGSRGWYYHKEYKAWLTRASNNEPLQKTDRFERGSFFLFDPTTWEVVRKDNFIVQFEHLERTPNMTAARAGLAAAPATGASAAGQQQPPAVAAPVPAK